MIMVFGLTIFASVVLISCDESCKGHEADIKNGQIKKAEKMGMQVNKISVEYIGNCEYKCVSDVYDPGSAYSTSNRINSTVVYIWDGDKYNFVRNE